MEVGNEITNLVDGVFSDGVKYIVLQAMNKVLEETKDKKCKTDAIKKLHNCNLLEYLTQRDIQTKNSVVNVRYRGKHRFFKGFNEFIKEKTRRCDNDFEKIERYVFF